MDLGQLVCDTVGDIGSCGRARVGSDNDSMSKLDRHNRCLLCSSKVCFVEYDGLTIVGPRV